MVHGPVAAYPPCCRPQSTLVYHRPGWTEPPAPAYLDILWYDAHLVAVHKPPGLQVLPAGPFSECTALTLLRRFHQQHAGELAGAALPRRRAPVLPPLWIAPLCSAASHCNVLCCPALYVLLCWRGWPVLNGAQACGQEKQPCGR